MSVWSGRTTASCCRGWLLLRGWMALLNVRGRGARTPRSPPVRFHALAACVRPTTAPPRSPSLHGRRRSEMRAAPQPQAPAPQPRECSSCRVVFPAFASHAVSARSSGCTSSLAFGQVQQTESLWDAGPGVPSQRLVLSVESVSFNDSFNAQNQTLRWHPGCRRRRACPATPRARQLASLPPRAQLGRWCDCLTCEGPLLWRHKPRVVWRPSDMWGEPWRLAAALQATCKPDACGTAHTGFAPRYNSVCTPPIRYSPLYRIIVIHEKVERGAAGGRQRCDEEVDIRLATSFAQFSTP